MPMYSALSKFFYVTYTLVTDPQLTSSRSSPKIKLTFNVLKIASGCLPRGFTTPKFCTYFYLASKDNYSTSPSVSVKNAAN